MELSPERPRQGTRQPTGKARRLSGDALKHPSQGYHFPVFVAVQLRSVAIHLGEPGFIVLVCLIGPDVTAAVVAAFAIAAAERYARFPLLPLRDGIIVLRVAQQGKLQTETEQRHSHEAHKVKILGVVIYQANILHVVHKS